MVSDGEYGIKASRLWEFGDEVKGDCFKREGVLQFDWMEGGSCLVCVRFVRLALSTALHIVSDKLLHVRPPVVVFEEGKCYNYWTICGCTCTISLIDLQLPYKFPYPKSCALMSYDSTGSL